LGTGGDRSGPALRSRGARQSGEGDVVGVIHMPTS
jgi:hypothetical protein